MGEAFPYGSFWRSRHGAFIRSRMGARGGVVPGDPAVVAMNKYFWVRWDSVYYPTAYTIRGTGEPPYVAGQRKFDVSAAPFETFRTMIYCDVPDVQINSAVISLGDANFTADRAWSLVLKKTSDPTPFDDDDAWNFTDLGTIATVANPWTTKYFVEAPYNYYAIDIPILTSAVQRGAPLWIIFTSDKDFDQSEPPSYSDEYMVSYLLRPQLLLNGATRTP